MTRSKSARILRPPSARKEMSTNEIIDHEQLRRSFYPPPHDCLGIERQRLDREKYIAKAKARSRSRDREKVNISIESICGTMAKTENNIKTIKLLQMCQIQYQIKRRTN